jgi:RNA polymerase sigma-70 factor (ECF subfamily)
MTFDQNRSQETGDPWGNEDQLIRALREHDHDACEAFVRQYGGRLLSTARRFLNSEQDASDAVQETFISAFQSIDRFEANSKIATWMHRIVVNVCLMKIRSRKRRHEVSIESLLPAFDKSGHQVTSPARWQNASDEELQSDETRAIVRRCIDRLPDDYRNVLVLRDLEELSTEESARLLQTSIGAVKTRLHRARQALRTLLEPYFAV